MPRKPAPAAYTNSLTINKIRLSVRLGCEKEERKTVQPVEINIKFFFPAVTKASLTDKGDFVCYDDISHRVKALCERKEFRLVEYLGMEIYRAVRKVVADEIKISIDVTKCSIPVEFVLGGATFRYTDFPPFSWAVDG